MYLFNNVIFNQFKRLYNNLIDRIEFPSNLNKIQIAIIIILYFFNRSLIDVLLCPSLLTSPCLTFSHNF